jgi:hypothetical protein
MVFPSMALCSVRAVSLAVMTQCAAGHRWQIIAGCSRRVHVAHFLHVLFTMARGHVWCVHAWYRRVSQVDDTAGPDVCGRPNRHGHGHGRSELAGACLAGVHSLHCTILYDSIFTFDVLMSVVGLQDITCVAGTGAKSERACAGTGARILHGGTPMLGM